MTVSDLFLCGLITAVLCLLWRRDLVVEEWLRSAIEEQKQTNALLAELIACFVPAEVSEHPEAHNASHASSPSAVLSPEQPATMPELP